MAERTEGHTVKRYDGELNHLRGRVLEMGGLAADQMRRSIGALEQQDVSEAREVVARDHRVNTLEVETDEELAQLLARRQPMAADLRMIIAVSKAVTDLERIGDEAAKISRMVIHLYDQDSPPPSERLLMDIPKLDSVARDMLRRALAAFDQLDLAEALAVMQSDGRMDLEFQSALRRLTTFVLEDARNVGHAINVTLILRALERIGDHAKNIAEYVVYCLEGRDVRHLDTSTGTPAQQI
jgi:phosphate transport system protein